MSDPTWVAPFLAAIASGCTTSEAAAAAGVSSTAPYNRRKANADFAAAWSMAEEDSVDILESTARRRAVDGIEEPVVYQGQLTYLFETDERGDTIFDLIDREVPTADGGVQVVKASVPRRKLDERGNPQVLTVRRPSDALMALLLKGRRKLFATERTELTGADGGPVAMDEVTRASRVAALLRAALNRKAADIDDIV